MSYLGQAYKDSVHSVMGKRMQIQETPIGKAFARQASVLVSPALQNAIWAVMRVAGAASLLGSACKEGGGICYKRLAEAQSHPARSVRLAKDKEKRMDAEDKGMPGGRSCWLP